MIYFISTQQKLFDSDIIKTCTVEDSLRYLSKLDSIAVDTETEGFDPHTNKILSLQLGDSTYQFVIDCSQIDIIAYKELLESKKLILHNAQFDLRFLRKYGILPTLLHDTFLAECILTTGYEDGNRKLGLGDVCYKYCGIKLNKDIRGQIHRRGLDSIVIKYGADDVAYLHEIVTKQLLEITKYNLNDILELENKVVIVFAKMSYDGIKLDSNKWLDVAKITEEAASNLQKDLDNIILSDTLFKKYIPYGIQQNLFGFEERIVDINWSSPKQKLEILHTIGIKEDSVGDRILQKNKKKHPIISKLIEYSKMSKLSTAFGKDFLKFINKKTGRVHSSFWQILSTGRISVSEPNLNQIPSKGPLAKSIRAAFIPENGYKIVGGDYSSFELAIIAEYSKDPLWVETLNNNGNLHSELCAKTFNISIEDVKKPFPPKPDLTYRDVQKTVDFGLAYGMSHFKLSDTIQVSENDAKKIINDFFKVVPDVKTFLTKLGEFGKANGYIYTPAPYSRIRWFPKWRGVETDFATLGEIERASMNTPIQGANAAVIKYALISIQERIDRDNLPIKILLSIYDEIQTECREDLAEWWKDELRDLMIEAAKKWLKLVPIEVDVKINDYWTK